MIVPSAAADTIAQSGSETLKGNAGIVMKAADIAQIDEHPVLQTVRFQHIVHLGEIGQGGLGALGSGSDWQPGARLRFCQTTREFAAAHNGSDQ